MKRALVKFSEQIFEQNRVLTHDEFRHVIAEVARRAVKRLYVFSSESNFTAPGVNSGHEGAEIIFSFWSVF